MRATDYLRLLPRLAGFGNRAHEVARFEEDFGKYVGCRHTIAVGSGRLGFDLLLRSLAVEPGSEVILPAFNLYAVVERFIHAGFHPVFADVRRDDLTLNTDDVVSLITPRTRVILATHMFGYACDLARLQAVAEERNIVLLEDCAHAFGTMYAGAHVGTFGRAGVFSLSPLKLITTFGGGIITTDDDALAENVRRHIAPASSAPGFGERFRRFGKGAALDFATRPLPFSLVTRPAMRLARIIAPDLPKRLLTEIPKRTGHGDAKSAVGLAAFQAVLGRMQLRRSSNALIRRRIVAEWLDAELADIPGVGRLAPRGPVMPNQLYYGILVDRPAELAAHLWSQGIDCESSEYCNCAELDIYREYRRSCPVSCEVQRRLLRIPNHPGLTKRHVERIAGSIREFHVRFPLSSAKIVREARLGSRCVESRPIVAEAPTPKDERTVTAS